MIAAPLPEWKKRFSQTIVPETFVEITMGVIDTEATANYKSVGFGNAVAGANTMSIIGVNENTNPSNFATLEENLWTLDGTKRIRFDMESLDTGYVGYPDTVNGGWYIDFNLLEVTTTTIPGFIIVWSSEYGEAPTSFAVTFKNTTTGKYSTLIFENGRIKTAVLQGLDWDMSKISLDNSVPHIYKVTGEFTGYDHVRIDFGLWNTPNHRPRLDRLVLGYTWVFTKKDLISYTHDQTADLICAELPKNSITFSLDNTDDKWNPYNPEGMGKYIQDRQMLTVRYGLDVNSNGYIYWIPGGTFYLSEWYAPSNGMEATFTARDPFEFMMNTPYVGQPSGTLVELVDKALECCDFPNKIKRYINSIYRAHPVTIPTKNSEEGYSVAQIIQMCASAMSGVCWFDRDGVLRIVRLPWAINKDQIYDIPQDIAYSHPEVTLNKPIKYTKISYNPTDGSPDSFTMDSQLWKTGETQTIDNPLIQNYTMAISVANDTKFSLGYREKVTGDFRADPRLDVFDWVKVSGKYGDMDLVVTEIKYTYTGCFHGEYTARKAGIPATMLEGEDTTG